MSASAVFMLSAQGSTPRFAAQVYWDLGDPSPCVGQQEFCGHAPYNGMWQDMSTAAELLMCM